MLNLRTFLLSTAIIASPVLTGCAANDKGKVNLDNGYKALEARDYERALTDANAYLQNDPAGKGSAEALYLKGRALEGRAANSPQESQADWTAAREAYQQALGQNPNKKLLPLVQSGLANACYWLEDFDTAARNWAIAYDGVDDANSKSYILYRVGLCMQRMGDFAGADQRFAMVQQQYPGTDAANKSREKTGFREFNVQIGTFANAQTANSTIGQLQKDGFVVRKGSDARGMTIVSLGPFPNYSQASTMRNRVAAKYPTAVVVP